MSKRRGMDPASHSMVSGLFTFALFGIFVVLALVIVVIGVDGYRGVVDTSASIGEVRTALGYVATKLRSDAASDGVRMTQAGGVDALVLTEDYEGDIYETYIFYKDGSLYEILLNAGDMEFDPDDGWRLADVADFSIALEAENLVNLSATAKDGRTQSMHIALRAAQEVQP